MSSEQTFLEFPEPPKIPNIGLVVPNIEHEENLIVTPEEARIGFELVRCNRGHLHKIQHIAPLTNGPYPCTAEDAIIRKGN